MGVYRSYQRRGGVAARCARTTNRYTSGRCAEPQSAGPTTASRVAGFLEGLAKAQYVAGRNVAIEYRWADGNYDRLKPLVEDLVRLNVAVIAALTQDAALAAKTHRART